MELVMPSEDRAAIEERLREIRNFIREQGGASSPTDSELGRMLVEQQRLHARLRQSKAGGLIADPRPGGILPIKPLPRRESGTGGPIPPGPDAVAEGPPRPSRRPWAPGGWLKGSPATALAGLERITQEPSNRPDLDFTGSPAAPTAQGSGRGSNLPPQGYGNWFEGGAGSALAGLNNRAAGVAGRGGPVGERGPVGGSEMDLSGFAGVLPQDPSGFFGDMGALSEPPLPALPTGPPPGLEFDRLEGLEWPGPLAPPSVQAIPPSSTGVGIPGAGAMPPPATPGPWGPGRLLPTPPGFDPNANTQKAPPMGNQGGPPSQVGGTIQYGPIGGPPGPKEPLMVSEITPEEFHRGGPPLGPTPSPSPRDFGTGYNQAEFDLPYGTWPSSVTGKGGTQMYLDPLPPPGPIKDYAPGTIPPPPSPEIGSPVPGQPTPNNPFGFGPSSQGPMPDTPYGGPNYFPPPGASGNIGYGPLNRDTAAPDINAPLQGVSTGPAPPTTNLAGLARRSSALPRTQAPLRAGSYRVGGLT